ncbi:hypothetical protein F7725_005202 [Dissostichus mawsoni]|uniref:Uncharacterized protein n=1 Tax=Dissostichus mawsoni TaxID=36200 RepID=A0A7J5YTR3_DISMA|nr:hypothetical protein F7725_005202 [Dissostichus mawsoni]
MDLIHSGGRTGLPSGEYQIPSFFVAPLSNHSVFSCGEPASCATLRVSSVTAGSNSGALVTNIWNCVLERRLWKVNLKEKGGWNKVRKKTSRKKMDMSSDSLSESDSQNEMKRTKKRIENEEWKVIVEFGEQAAAKLHPVA